jgi:outer membrane protein OmpA-like peptidoglycan-associated protein
LADKLGALLGGAAAPAADTTVAAAAPAAGAPENLTVYFANASARLNGEANTKIAGAVEQLKALPEGTSVLIVGHASKTGNAAANEKLSDLRANNVKDALVAGLGDKASNITFKVEFRGDSQPDEDAAKSRKVTIEIQPKS